MLTGNKNVDIKILGELEDKDLANIYQVNKKSNEICNDPGFWLNRILIKFPYLDIDILKRYKNNKTWSQYYINDLIKINPSNAQDELINWSKYGRLDLVIVALNKGADICSEYNSAVRWASGNGHLDVVKYLAERGADIHDYDDLTLRWAGKSGHLDVVKYLVENGADPRADSDYGMVLASMNGHLEVVKYLVEKGVGISTYNYYSVNVAMKYGHNDVVDYLVSQGSPDPR